MGLLIAVASLAASVLGFLVLTLKVLVGLGMVIFVHELGHFLVAKLCGVKCEKFYLGFDFFGLKIWHRRWGETEYGIGVFPLGGYVKMLGQEDNPARLREEFERAKLAEAGGGGEAGAGGTGHPGADAPDSPTDAPGSPTDAPDSPTDAPGSPGEPMDLEAVRAALYDPRSYLAKSVPRRMAIISAGVVMNVIFAWVAATIAFVPGVQEVACGVGEVVPGKAAWEMNIESGDQVVEIAGRKVDRFQQLRTGISLGDLADGVEMVLRRPDREEPLRLTIMPDRDGQLPTIGVGMPFTDRLGDQLAAIPGKSAAQARPSLKPGDRVAMIDGAPVASYAEVRRKLALVPDRTVKITVQRGASAPAHETDSPQSGPEQVTVEVAPQPILRLGLIMEMGPVTAVQKGSSAEAKGILPGDVLQLIDGQKLGDPMTLAERLRRRAGEKVEVSVLRQGKTVVFPDVELRRTETFFDSFAPDSPVAIPTLGIACQVKNTVAGVFGPAAEAKILPKSVVVSASILPPDKKTIEAEGLEKAVDLLDQQTVAIAFDDKTCNWPYLLSRLQNGLPGTTVELNLAGPQGEKQKVTLAPAPGTDWFDPLRGLVFELQSFKRQAASVGEAMTMGYHEAVNALSLIWRILQKLGSGQVPITGIAGPVGIIREAGRAAAAGPGELLMFLCFLSANLAILNFLPIPVLDGGHMVFLTYEGIRGKPPSERIVVGLSIVGLVLILALMVFALGLDVRRLLGWS